MKKFNFAALSTATKKFWVKVVAFVKEHSLALSFTGIAIVLVLLGSLILSAGKIDKPEVVAQTKAQLPKMVLPEDEPAKAPKKVSAAKPTKTTVIIEEIYVKADKQDKKTTKYKVEDKAEKKPTDSAEEVMDPDYAKALKEYNILAGQQ